jgi:hypothetical protein
MLSSSLLGAQLVRWSRTARISSTLGPAKQKCFSKDEAAAGSEESALPAIGVVRMNSSGAVANRIGRSVQRKEEGEAKRS